MRLSLTLCALTLPSLLRAQATFVVPSKANTTQPGVTYFDNSVQPWVFWGAGFNSACRVQYLYDCADIPIANGLLSALAVRAPANSGFVADSYQTQIALSVGPNSSATPTTLFASNHGSSLMTVFAGTINMPATGAGAWPAPWQAPVPFASPFSFSATLGTSLVVEFHTTSSLRGGAWSIEGYRAEVGNTGTELSQSSCRNSANLVSSGWGWSSAGLIPGGSLSLVLFDYPINSPTFGANVLFVAAGGLGSPIGPYVTPFNLGLVAPSRPNCQWAIDIVNAVTVPMAYTASNGAMSLSPALPLPSGNFMRNRVLYTQNLGADLDAANNVVLFPSVAIRWLIGTNNQVPVGNVRQVYDPAGGVPSAGVAMRSDGASLRLTY